MRAMVVNGGGLKLQPKHSSSSSPELDPESFEMMA